MKKRPARDAKPKRSSGTRDYQNCHDTLVAMRWPESVTCPHCGSDHVSYMPKYRRWRCHAGHPAPQFSLRTGTVFRVLPHPAEQVDGGDLDDRERQERDQQP